MQRGAAWYHLTAPHRSCIIAPCRTAPHQTARSCKKNNHTTPPRVGPTYDGTRSGLLHVPRTAVRLQLRQVVQFNHNIPPHPHPSNAPPSPQWLYVLQDTHDKLVHSFQNRQIYPLKRFIVSTHRLSPPPPPPPPPLPLDQTQAPTSLKTPPSPHELFDLQDSLDILMHFLPQLAVRFCPPRKRVLKFPRTD